MSKKRKYLSTLFPLICVLALISFLVYTNSKPNAIVKISVFNDGTVIVNDSTVKYGKYAQAINSQIQVNSEIWLWLENPYGIPKGVAYDVSVIITELSIKHVVKLYSDKTFSGDYQLISNHGEEF